jgi:hypothetical protein
LLLDKTLGSRERRTCEVLYVSHVARFPYRLIGEQAVTAVVATVASDPDFIAGCLVCSGAHGYSMELEYMQRRDGGTRYRVWSDVQGTIDTEERALSFDIASVLERVRAEGLAECSLPDDGPIGGRRALIVLADAADGTWVDTPAPRVGAPRTGPLAPLFDVVFPA